MKQIIVLLISLTFLISCNSKEDAKQNKNTEKIGVIIVNHGSNSDLWREMLTDVELSVKEELLQNKKISDVRTAFMEYTEPSLATRLKEYDEEGYSEVIIVPLFLTVSSHYSHDIPEICGVSNNPKIREQLAKENIEVYKAKANVTITPPLDYTSILKKNIERRVIALSDDSSNEGILLVAYGDADYNQQWEEMVNEIGKYLKLKTGHESVAYSWCGHLVGYSTQPTMDGIEKLFELEDNVIVVPLLVANDSYFQNDIIQTAVDNSVNSTNVKYIQDAILPDDNLNKWVIDITNNSVDNL